MFFPQFDCSKFINKFLPLDFSYYFRIDAQYRQI